MEFLLGLASVIPTALFNKAVIKLVPKIKPELTLGAVMLMVFGTATITIFWAIGLKPSSTDTNQFFLGMCGALIMNMAGKILYMLQNPID